VRWHAHRAREDSTSTSGFKDDYHGEGFCVRIVGQIPFGVERRIEGLGGRLDILLLHCRGELHGRQTAMLVGTSVPEGKTSARENQPTSKDQSQTSILERTYP